MYNRPLDINNPGALRTTSDNWQGKTGDYNGFVIFSKPEYGYRAMFKNLYSYFQYGYNTVSKIISTWGKVGVDDIQSYINFVCKMTGFSPDQKLKVDEATFKALAKAITVQENGVVADLNQLNKGYSMAFITVTTKQIEYGGAGLLIGAGLLWLIFK